MMWHTSFNQAHQHIPDQALCDRYGGRGCIECSALHVRYTNIVFELAGQHAVNALNLKHCSMNCEYRRLSPYKR